MIPVLPILIPLATAIICILAGGGRSVQRWVSAIGSAAHAGAACWLLSATQNAGIIAVQLGNWPAPFGITLVSDVFSALMVAVCSFVGLSVGIFALRDVDAGRERFGFYPLYHILMMGVCGAFLTGDLFNLFVWFEVMLMASFVLLGLGGERPQIEAAVKYVTINFIASGLFLTALGILYGKAGTLNMADLAVKIAGEGSGAAHSSAMLLLVAFGIKAGIFPLFFWLPASYHTPPAAVSAVFAGLLTKVGVYAMIRLFTLVFTGDAAATHQIIIASSVLTMLTGVLGAAAQGHFRRVLSFHIISQIGYMTLGLGLFTHAAIAASVFYIIHHILVKTNLFLVAGAVGHLQGTERLQDLGGLFRQRPWLAAIFLVPALSLAGIPPLSGFFAKFGLVKAGLEVESYVAVTVALLVGLLTLFSMTKLWHEAFWKAAPESSRKKPADAGVPVLMMIPMVALALVTLWISVYPQPLFEASAAAATQLLDPSAYIEAVLGPQP